MSFSEFKAKVMSQADFGTDTSQFPRWNEHLRKTGPKDQAALIAAVLSKGMAGLDRVQDHFVFIPFDELSPPQERGVTIAPLFRLMENPEVVDSDIEKIFTSPWMRQCIADTFPERYQWIFSFYNFRKAYAMLFLDSLQKMRPFIEWREVIIPNTSTLQKPLELRDLILKILRHWPTNGRSGYALLTRLRELEPIKIYANDQEVQAALDEVEGRCDFGSLDKVRALLSQGR